MEQIERKRRLHKEHQPGNCESQGAKKPEDNLPTRHQRLTSTNTVPLTIPTESSRFRACNFVLRAPPQRATGIVLPVLKVGREDRQEETCMNKGNTENTSADEVCWRA